MGGNPTGTTFISVPLIKRFLRGMGWAGKQKTKQLKNKSVGYKTKKIIIDEIFYGAPYFIVN